MKLIDKDALMAEIEKSVKLLFENNDRLYDEYGNYFYKNSENDYRFYHKLDEYDWDEDRIKLTELTEYLFHFNTLEVKEVDLNKEIDRAWDNTSDNFSEEGWKEFEDIAKHFFELGLKAQKGKEV